MGVVVEAEQGMRHRIAQVILAESFEGSPERSAVGGTDLHKTVSLILVTPGPPGEQWFQIEGKRPRYEHHQHKSGLGTGTRKTESFEERRVVKEQANDPKAQQTRREKKSQAFGDMPELLMADLMG